MKGYIENNEFEVSGSEGLKIDKLHKQFLRWDVDLVALNPLQSNLCAHWGGQA